MRTILFRGRDYEGKWHKGSLVVINVEKPRQKDIAPYEVYYIKEQSLEGDEHAVDPNTIGQLVFEATKMHPDIWEGDIIDDKNGRRMEVMFEPYRHTFYVIAHSKTNTGFGALDEGYLHFKFKNHGAKVVGNIHDNPELITKPFAQPHENAQTN